MIRSLPTDLIANNHFQEENKIIRRLFDLELILTFQLKHDVQIIRGGDYQYQCFIDKEAYGTSLTPVGALVFGIKQHEIEEVQAAIKALQRTKLPDLKQQPE